MKKFICLLCILLSACDGDGNDNNNNNPQASEADWQQITLPVDLDNVRAVRVFPDGDYPLVLFAGHQFELIDGDHVKIFYSDNRGKTWSEDDVALLDYSDRYDQMTVDISDSVNPDQFYFTTREAAASNSSALSPGVRLRSYSFNSHIAGFVTQGTNGVYTIVRRDSGTTVLYRATSSEGGGGGPGTLKVSYDEGASFASIGSAFPKWPFPNEANDLLSCYTGDRDDLAVAADGRVAFVCREQRYISDDEGKNWRQLPQVLDANGNPITPIVGLSSYSQTLILDPLERNVIYLSDTESQNLYRNDGADTWEARPLPEHTVAVHFSGTDATVLYAAAGAAGAYVSRDAGLSWELLEDDLSGLTVVDVRDDHEGVYLFAEEGIYYRRNE